jgi:uncharacterized protein (TIGR02271 family)
MDNPTDEDEGTPKRGSPAVTIELLEEELIADKQRVQTGLVRIRRQLITEPRTFEVTISREELEIEHLPLRAGTPGQPHGAPDDQEPQTEHDGVRILQPGETLTLTLLSEEVVVQRQPVVTSEVIIGKRLVEELQSLSAVVRREVADITHSGNLDVELDQNSQVAR